MVKQSHRVLFRGAALSVVMFLFLSLTTTSVRALDNEVKIKMTVDSAIAMTIISSSDDGTYAVSSTGKMIYGEGNSYKDFGESSAKISIKPSMKDESMYSEVTVFTNNLTGYTLTVSDTDHSTSLKSLRNIIPAGTNIEVGVSNWAFKGGKITEYTAMPNVDNPTVIASDTNPDLSGQTVVVNYGISTSGDQESGVYTDTVVYTATANDPDPTPEFYTITTMQQMNSIVCNSVPTPDATSTRINAVYSPYKMTSEFVPSTTLTDVRDNKTYTVRKLADGNCWMTENLALNLDSNVALTSDTTDLNTKDSWTPELTTGSAWLASGNRPYSRSSTESGYGNYYGWAAATAVNSTSEHGYDTDYVAQDSICPKGWQLPTATGNKSIYKLTTDVYNVRSTDAVNDPLNFVLAGGWGNYVANYVGQTGLYWTNTAASASSIYHTQITSTGTRNVASGDGLGWTIRCVAR